MLFINGDNKRSGLAQERQYVRYFLSHSRMHVGLRDKHTRSVLVHAQRPGLAPILRPTDD